MCIRDRNKRWRTRKGVRLAPASENWLDAMTKATGVDVEVTSGVRSPLGQAHAMRSKIKGGASEQDLLDLYGDDRQVMELYPLLIADDLPAAAEVIERHMSEGRYLSRHIARPSDPDSWALDIDLDPGPSGSELLEIIAYAKSTGVRPVNEGNHLHLEKR